MPVKRKLYLHIGSVPLLAAAVLLLLGGLGCKAQEEITYVPTPKPASDRVIIEHVTEAPDHSVSVNGYGEVLAKPDFASISLAAVTSAETAEGASALCADMVDRLFELAVTNGISQRDVTIQGIDLTPVLGTDANSITGYIATQPILLTVRNVDTATALRSAAIDAGAKETSAITYSITDTSAAYLSALSLALSDAESKALTIAETSGVRLGAIIGVTEGNKPDNSLIGVTFASSAIVVSADVVVLYDILGA